MSDARGENQRTGKHGWRITLPATKSHSPNPSQGASGGIKLSAKNPWKTTLEEKLRGIV